jgi:hypothetical protein
MARDDAQAAPERILPTTRFRHDGLYLRFAGGLGILRDRAESGEGFRHPSSGEFKAFDGAGSGMAAATEVALGATPGGGFAIGGAIYTATVPSLEMDDTGVSEGRYDYELSQLALFALHADFYPDPEQGLHFQAGLGLAAYIAGMGFPVGQGQDARAHTSTGFGLMLGAGHEWWVAEQWSMGLLARMLYAWTGGVDPESLGWNHKTFAPTLMVTATYH